VTIVSDGWSDPQRRPLINFMVINEPCPCSTFFFNLDIFSCPCPCLGFIAYIPQAHKHTSQPKSCVSKYGLRHTGVNPITY